MALSKTNPTGALKWERKYEKAILKIVDKFNDDVVDAFTHMWDTGELRTLEAGKFDATRFSPFVDKLADKKLNKPAKRVVKRIVPKAYAQGEMFAKTMVEGLFNIVLGDVLGVREKVGELVLKNEIEFKGFSTETSRRINRTISDGIIDGKPKYTIVNDLRDGFEMTRNNATRIVRTETMRATNRGVKDKYRSAGIEVVKWMATIQPGRTCEECKALNGKLFPIDKTPPIPKHPRCRCTLSPVPDPDWSEVEGWDGEKVTPPKEKKKGAKVSDEWNKRVDKEQRSKIDQEVLEKYGSFDPEDINDYKNKVNKKLKDAVDNSDVKVRIHNKTLEKVFESGRIKTQFESGTSSGIQNREMRLEFENKYFGYPRDTPDIERPIYGYLTPKGTTPEKDVSTLSQYGDIVVKLKDSERGRVTFNLGDSIDQTRGGGLNPITRPVLAPSKLSDPNIRSISLELFDPAKITKTNRIKDRMGKIRYVEAHIHGGIRLSDIAEIKIQPHKYADKVLEKYRRMAEEYGIKISIG